VQIPIAGIAVGDDVATGRGHRRSPDRMAAVGRLRVGVADFVVVNRPASADRRVVILFERVEIPPCLVGELDFVNNRAAAGCGVVVLPDGADPAGRIIAGREPAYLPVEAAGFPPRQPLLDASTVMTEALRQYGAFSVTRFRILLLQPMQRHRDNTYFERGIVPTNLRRTRINRNEQSS
jgi:hypothetical protein